MVRDSTLPEGAPTAGRPVLAPKAQEAFNKGLEALGQNNMKEAEKQIGEAARLAPGHPDVLYAQGVLYLRERKWPEAREVLEKATQVDPNHSQAFSALGMTYVNEGKYDAAIPALETAARLQRVVMVDLIVAWRVLALCKAGRETPQGLASDWLSAEEWRALWCYMNQRTRPPRRPPRSCATAPSYRL